MRCCCSGTTATSPEGGSAQPSYASTRTQGSAFVTLFAYEYTGDVELMFRKEVEALVKSIATSMQSEANKVKGRLFKERLIGLLDFSSYKRLFPSLVEYYNLESGDFFRDDQNLSNSNQRQLFLQKFADVFLSKFHIV
jgi:hypothetical protein